MFDLYAKSYIECVGTEFGTLQIRQHIRSVGIPDVEITSVDCIQIEKKNITSTEKL